MRSQRPDARGFEAIAAALPWLRQLSTTVAAPAGDDCHASDPWHGPARASTFGRATSDARAGMDHIAQQADDNVPRRITHARDRRNRRAV